MERWKNRVAVVVGASGAVGKAVSKDLLSAGLRVVGIDVNSDVLTKVRSDLPKSLQENFFPRKCDITDELDVNTTFQWIDEVLGGTDILVNSAGKIASGSLLEVDSATINQVIQVNVMGLVNTTRAAVRSMRARNSDGHLVHMNSVCGHYVVGTKGNMYSPSKFAVTSINDTLRLVLQEMDSKIKTTSISPGYIRSPLIAYKNLADDHPLLEPADVSEAILFAISRPPHVLIHELTIRVLGENF